MQREKWFDKIAWGYMPCHWKGVAVMAAVIFPTAAAIFVGQTVLDYLGYRSADWLPFFAFFVPALLLLERVARRHS